MHASWHPSSLTRAAARPLARPSAWPRVVAVGLLAGSLDLVFAAGYWAVRDVAPERIVQAIAAWLIGRDAAFGGGWQTVALGAALHYALMIATAAGYYLASIRLAVLRQWPLAAGALYGAGCYVLVHVIAVPLSAAPPPPDLPLDWQLACLAVYVLLVGVPCGVLARSR